VSVAVESVPWHRPVRAPAPAPPVPTPPPPAPLPAAPAVENRPGNDVAVVFVHGLFSDANTWSHFHKLITADPELDPVGLCYFRYATPFASPAPTRRIPDLDIIGRQLGTYFENDLGDLPNVVLVTHSQGGLVAQFFIEQMLNNGRGLDLARIKQLIMFACPNGGSELFLTMRRFLSKHPQERDLRPLNKRINEAHEVLLNKVIHAKEITEHTCPIPIAAYAGAEDNVVVPASALTVLPHQHTGVLPGGHSSIIQPTSPADSAYVTLRKKVRSVLDAAGQRHQTTPGGQGE
jgi:pimeloyl-ACP methyl ester carboxylesterase